MNFYESKQENWPRAKQNWWCFQNNLLHCLRLVSAKQSNYSASQILLITLNYHIFQLYLIVERMVLYSSSCVTQCLHYFHLLTYVEIESETWRCLSPEIEVLVILTMLPILESKAFSSSTKNYFQQGSISWSLVQCSTYWANKACAS